MRTATPFSTWLRITERWESATSEDNSRPRLVPLALLAMTGPYLVRVITSSVAGVGGNVGRLTSVGTLGSLAGTLLIGYLLIPLLPNSLTMYVTALALMLICSGYFLFCRRKWPAALVLLLALGPA